MMVSALVFDAHVRRLWPSLLAEQAGDVYRVVADPVTARTMLNYCREHGWGAEPTHEAFALRRLYEAIRDALEGATSAGAGLEGRLATGDD